MIGRRIALTALVIGALIGPGKAADDSAIAGLAWGDESARVIKHLREICHDLDIAEPERVQVPLARHAEQHVSCRDMQLPTGEISSAVLVVADNGLKMVEAHGGAVQALAGERIESASTFLSYRVLDDGRLFADLEADTVWLLSEAALHPHLFMWSNPYLSQPDEAPSIYDTSAALPPFIQFGAELESAKALLAGTCSIMAIKTIEPVWLPHGPETQTQIDCFGIEYAGFPRKLEIVFGDGALELVWILTAKPEEERVRQALVDVFGRPDHGSASWDVFPGGQIALRKDKPEVLAISERLVPYYAEAEFVE